MQSPDPTPPPSNRRALVAEVAGVWLFAMAACYLLFEHKLVDAEQILMRLFGSSRLLGPFDSVNRIAFPYTAILVTWLALMFLYWTRNRRFEAAILLVGMLLGGIAAALAGGDFSDPAWFTMLAVHSIGLAVGIAVSLCVWCRQFWPRPANSNLPDRSAAD